MLFRHQTQNWALGVLIAIVVAPAALGQTTVTMNVNAAQAAGSISPYIYGRNGDSTTPFTRVGGNRLTAYNWENNSSNAGSDWFHQNDGLMSSSNVPGEAMRPAINNAAANNQALVLTVPMAGYVAADKSPGGDVATSGPNYLQTRFKVSLPSKGAPFTLTPDASDGYVYQDEFINWVENSARQNPDQPIFYSLDNEPDLWSETHARIHPDKATYAELRQRSIDYATAIKAVAPNTLVFGAVNYGWHGFRTLQDAPDRAGRDFHEYFLAEMAAADQAAGKRLIDVLDLHWYPEARGLDANGNSQRIVFGPGQDDGSPGIASARVQSTRSLWDPTYTETSWITQWSTLGPINLLGRVHDDIDTYYPGTKIAITEYNYGGGGHISGGIAQADALGVFGREGVFAAGWWDLSGDADAFTMAAFDMYLDYDGAGSGFGDQAVAASTSDIEKTSIYASIDENDPNRVVLVLINRSTEDVLADLEIAHPGTFQTAQVYQLLASSSAIVQGSDLSLVGNAAEYLMPANSVTTMELYAVPEPGSLVLAGLSAVLLLRRRRL
jgi:hypothetical protein